MPTFEIGKPLPEHPRYREQVTARSFWSRSDRARWDYADGQDAAGYAILPKHEREPDDRFARRKRQAMARRFVRPIINRYTDFTTREPPKRPDAKAGPYFDLLNDVDGQGTSMDELMKRALRASQIGHVSYLLADANDPNRYLSAAEDMKAGKRGIVRLVDADDVVWWREHQGALLEAIIRFTDTDGIEFAWYVTPLITQRINLKKNETEGSNQLVVASLDDEIPHGYGGCPLVRLCPDFDDCPGDESQAAPLAESQKRICNIDSWLLEELQHATFTTTVFLGVSADSVKSLTVGPGNAVCLPNSGGSNPSIGKLGADTAQAESIRKSLEYEIRELYRVAGLAPGNPTQAGQPESGVAKAFAFNEIEAKCAAMADAMENAENRVVLLLSNGFGWSFPGKADYPDTFQAPDLAEELAKLIQMQSAGLPDVLVREQIQRIASSGFELDDAQNEQLRKELDAKGAEAAKAEKSEIINPAARTSGT